jgi:hypothetical protein
MPDDQRVPIRDLILVPSLITLAITILRLVGELLNWSPALFGKESGGNQSLVGISWLVPIFGIYFAVRLVRMGFAPASVWKTVGSAVGAIVLMMAGAAVPAALKLPPLVILSIAGVASWVAVWVAWRAWPALGSTTLAYALAARVPVAILMLAAIVGRWGTHYDVANPAWPAVDAWNPVLKWLAIGALPQLTLWIGFTVGFGMLFGAVAAAIARRAQPAPA